MPDLIFSAAEGYKIRLKDMGDGTYAAVVFAAQGEIQTGGAPVGPTNPLPVAVLLRPIYASAEAITLNGSAQAVTNALPAGTVAVRLQKTAGVGVRYRVMANNSDPITTSLGDIMLPDITGFVDIPAAPGQWVQVIRAAGDTNSGQFVVTPLSV